MQSGSGGLVEEEEERVDEIECKVFIKRSDSNLLSICGELALGDGPYSEAMTCRRSLWNSLWSSTRREISAAVGQTFRRLSDRSEREREKERERGRGSAISRHSDSWGERPANQGPIRISTLGTSKITCSHSQAQTGEIHFIIVSSAVALLGSQKGKNKVQNHDSRFHWEVWHTLA